jgi:hypothetical protein
MQTLPRPTPLQEWLVAALIVFEHARDELDTREFETWLDLVATRVAREYVALFLRDDLGEQRVA